MGSLRVPRLSARDWTTKSDPVARRLGGVGVEYATVCTTRAALRIAALACVALLGCGCQDHAEQRSPTSNGNYDVARLFVHEGCAVYRFYDGDYRYYVRCGRDSVVTMSGHQEYCGEACGPTQYRWVPEEIATVSR